MTKQEAIQAFKKRRKALNGRSTSTAKALNVVSQLEALAYASKPERPYSMEGRKAPPRGRALYIQTVGHLAVRQNPMTDYWASGHFVPFDRGNNKLCKPLQPMTYSDLVSLFATPRNDHPARKT